MYPYLPLPFLLKSNIFFRIRIIARDSLVYFALVFGALLNKNTISQPHDLPASCLYNVIIDVINNSPPEMYVVFRLITYMFSKNKLHPTHFQPGPYHILHRSAFSQLTTASLITRSSGNENGAQYSRHCIRRWRSHITRTRDYYPIQSLRRFSILSALVHANGS